MNQAYLATATATTTTKALVAAAPMFSLTKKLGIAHLDQLPSIRWKLGNIQRLKDADPAKFQAQSQELQTRMA